MLVERCIIVILVSLLQHHVQIGQPHWSSNVFLMLAVLLEAQSLVYMHFRVVILKLLYFIVQLLKYKQSVALLYFSHSQRPSVTFGNTTRDQEISRLNMREIRCLDQYTFSFFNGKGSLGVIVFHFKVLLIACFLFLFTAFFRFFDR